MGKFEERFGYITLLSDGSYALDAQLGKDEFIRQYKEETGMTLNPDFIELVEMRFGFAPDSVENREDFEGAPIWHTCRGASGIKKALVWSLYRQNQMVKRAHQMTEFEDGVRARMRGAHITDNPYSNDNLLDMSPEKESAAYWRAGWFEADKGDDCENGRGGDDSK